MSTDTQLRRLRHDYQSGDYGAGLQVVLHALRWGVVDGVLAPFPAEAWDESGAESLLIRDGALTGGAFDSVDGITGWAEGEAKRHVRSGPDVWVIARTDSSIAIDEWWVLYYGASTGTCSCSYCGTEESAEICYRGPFDGLWQHIDSDDVRRIVL